MQLAAFICAVAGSNRQHLLARVDCLFTPGCVSHSAFGPAALLARAIIRKAYQSAPPDAILVSALATG